MAQQLSQGIWECWALCWPCPCPWLPGLGHTQPFCHSLQENAIGDEGMAALSAALKVNTTLADLQCVSRLQQSPAVTA